MIRPSRVFRRRASTILVSSTSDDGEKPIILVENFLSGRKELTGVITWAEFALAYFKRGKCYMMMHDYKRALYDFSAAILNETRSPSK